MRYFIYLVIIGIGVYFSYPGITKTLNIPVAETLTSENIGSAFTSDTPRNPTPAGNNTPYFKRMSLEISKGHKLTYFWKNPPGSFKKGTKFPLVLILHGAAGWAHAAFYLPGEIHNQFPAFVFVPVLPKNAQWSNNPTFQKGDALPEIVNVIKKFETKYPIDPNRIYVIGCSMGGVGAFAAARHYPDIFAASIPIAGAWNPADADSLTKVPLLAMHGSLDKSIPPDSARETIVAVHKLGGKAKFIEFSKLGHQCDAPEFYGTKIWKWLFSQKINQKE